MLFESTVEPRTLQLLKDLQNLKDLHDFILVGVTSLAIQFGHRTSIDLDLFSSTELDVSNIPKIIAHLDKVEIANQTKSILNLFIDDIKVDFVSYNYSLIKEPISIANLKLASIEDISAMKLAAIVGRGSRKDFIDLFFILKRFSLPEILGYYSQKYPDGSEFLIFKSLTYFDDAELEPMPRMLNSTNWTVIKNEIIKQVKIHFP